MFQHCKDTYICVTNKHFSNFFNMIIPEINSRIMQLIEYKSNRSVNKFAKSINIAQQTINRLFNIDNRTKKYPLATTEMLVAIVSTYSDINSKWLLTGAGEMFKSEENNSSVTEIIYKSDPKDAEIIAANKEIVDTQKELIISLKERIRDLEQSTDKKSTSFHSVHCVESTGKTHQGKQTK